MASDPPSPEPKSLKMPLGSVVNALLSSCTIRTEDSPVKALAGKLDSSLFSRFLSNTVKQRTKPAAENGDTPEKGRVRFHASMLTWVSHDVDIGSMIERTIEHGSSTYRRSSPRYSSAGPRHPSPLVATVFKVCPTSWAGSNNAKCPKALDRIRFSLKSPKIHGKKRPTL